MKTLVSTLLIAMSLTQIAQARNTEACGDIEVYRHANGTSVILERFGERLEIYASSALELGILRHLDRTHACVSGELTEVDGHKMITNANVIR
jgi:hypothetical protein